MKKNKKRGKTQALIPEVALASTGQDDGQQLGVWRDELKSTSMRSCPAPGRGRLHRALGKEVVLRAVRRKRPWWRMRDQTAQASLGVTKHLAGFGNDFGGFRLM